ncbi:MAG: shikimate kinase [Phycisphaeraceae bacterium]
MDDGRNIILIGYRASGKTTIGKQLAEELWKKFIDVDDETCKRFGGKTIAQIWEESGEPAWRREEAAVTQELVARKGLIIGLGGGTLMQPEARKAVEEAANAVRIYFKCHPDELYRRISEDKKSAATRPNLTRHAGSIEEIKEMLALREPVYEAVADVVFDVTHVTPDSALRYVIKRCL